MYLVFMDLRLRYPGSVVTMSALTVLTCWIMSNEWLQVISGLFTLAVMGAVGYWWLTKNSGGDDEDEPPKPKQKSSASRSSDDLNDPLSEAQRIMDKYK